MNKNLTFTYILMLFVQVIICQIFQFGPYCIPTLLPVMLMCMPTDWSSLKCMVVAFLSGLFVDFFGDGLLGLNAFALVPLAFVRNFILSKSFNEDLIARGELISWRKWGVLLILRTAVLFIALFLALYIVMDAAGERGFLPCLQTFGISLATNIVLGVGVLHAFLEK